MSPLDGVAGSLAGIQGLPNGDFGSGDVGASTGTSTGSVAGTPAANATSADGVSFTDVLTDAVKSIDGAQKTADAKAEALANGSLDDIHGTMISIKEAELSMKLAGTVRNKLLDAFHELWRINL